MASRKVKHARAMAKRELFFKTVQEGNQDWLKTAQTQRLAEQKKAEQARVERRNAKSARLAAANKAKPSAPKNVTGSLSDIILRTNR